MAVTNQIKGAPILSEHMPVRVVERGDGFYVLETEFTAYHLNAAGVVHGGVIAAFLDCGLACGGASGVDRGEGKYGVTVSMTVNFVAEARTGLHRLEARVIGGGARTKFVDARIMDPAGRGPVATATATVKVIDMPGIDRASGGD